MESERDKSVPVAFRLGKKVYEVLNRRASHNRLNVNEYVKKRVIYDTMRKHG